MRNLAFRSSRTSPNNAPSARPSTPDRAQEAVYHSWIARRVINGFGISIGCVLVLIAVGGAITEQWSTVIAATVDILKSAVVPIVTLVLGYYFDRSSW